MAFDAVHDIQRAFRKTVRAFSFPGRVFDLSGEGEGQAFGTAYPASLFVVARMLLDTETSFACSDEALAGTIEMLTFARREEVSRADFVFVDGSGEELLEVLRRAKGGTLVDPHDSATIVVVADIGERYPLWKLTGPGIEDQASCRFYLSGGWERERAERNREFPLGLDMLLVSADDRLIALPRTTSVMEGEKRWDT